MPRLPRWVEQMASKKEKQNYRALRSLLAGSTTVEAAAIAGISIPTLHRRGIAKKAREIQKQRPHAQAS